MLQYSFNEQVTSEPETGKHHTKITNKWFLSSWAVTLNIRLCPLLKQPWNIIERACSSKSLRGMSHLTVNILWAILRMWLRWEGRHTNLDCWQSSALGEPSVCALTEDTQTKGWEPGTSCPQPPFSPSSCLVHLYLQRNPERSINIPEKRKVHLLFLTAISIVTVKRFSSSPCICWERRETDDKHEVLKTGDPKKKEQHSLKPAKCERHSCLRRSAVIKT